MESEQQVRNVIFTHDLSESYAKAIKDAKQSNKIEGFFYTVGVAATVLFGAHVFKKAMQKMNAREKAATSNAENHLSLVDDKD